MFNNAFQDCRRLKAVQIEGILTRNVRIREICDYFEVAVNIDEIKYDFEEDITQIFVVNDSEVIKKPYKIPTSLYLHAIIMLIPFRFLVKSI